MIRTVGIKSHKDEAQVCAGNEARNRNFRCYLCKRTFRKVRDLNSHFKVEHNGLDCDTCGKEFCSPLSLKKHTYVHWNLPCKCSRCDKSFPFKSECAHHEKVHDKLRFVCKKEGCSKSFSRDSDLKLHQELHDAAPIKCKPCDYQNRDIRNVRQHIRTHSDVKPYTCSQCGAQFHFAMQKKRHKCELEQNVYH